MITFCRRAEASGYQPTQGGNFGDDALKIIRSISAAISIKQAIIITIDEGILGALAYTPLLKHLFATDAHIAWHASMATKREGSKRAPAYEPRLTAPP